MLGVSARPSLSSRRSSTATQSRRPRAQRRSSPEMAAVRLDFDTACFAKELVEVRVLVWEGGRGRAWRYRGPERPFTNERSPPLIALSRAHNDTDTH